MIEYNDIIKTGNARLDKINFPVDTKNIEVYLKREDLIHPAVSGNKWYKLKHNLIHARRQKYNTLLTFGGAFSNHIYAVAAAGNIFGFNTIGLIRGEKHAPLNPTLKFATEHGMRLIYIDRTSFKRKNEEDFRKNICKQFGNVYILPEGGTNEFAVTGVAEIVDSIKADYDYLCCSCGTGGTIAGLIKGTGGNKKILGFSALKGGDFLKHDVRNLLSGDAGELKNWEINLNYHFGGYAKINLELINFVIEFERINKIVLDYIYTGKMMYGLYDLIKAGYFEEGSRIIAIHTGGVQGNLGMNERKNKILKRSGNEDLKICK